MAVAVALAVGAPVMVAALGNCNDIVKVNDAARGSRVDELREHGHDALEQVDAALVQLAFDLATSSFWKCSMPAISVATVTGCVLVYGR